MGEKLEITSNAYLSLLQIAAKMAGFSLSEADLLRRAVSKKQKEILDKERFRFVQGAIQKGYEEQTANEIYNLIVRFANYGFNRSHAVAYSLIAYQLAYLKTYFPLHFMAALLTSVIGNEGKLGQYIREAKKMGLKILPPSINQSGYTFLVEKNAIRFSLSSIKGIGISVLKEIFTGRKGKKYIDLFDFCIRVSGKTINRKVLESLVHSGCFDEFGEDRATLLASLDVAIEHADLVKPNDFNSLNLFLEDDFFIKPKYVEVDPISSEDKLFFEKEVLGLYLSSHPVSVYEKYFERLYVTPVMDMQSLGKKVKGLVYLSNIKTIRTKQGEQMAFLNFSDQSGEMEAVVFPTIYKKIQLILQKGAILLVEGKIEERDGRKQMLLQNIQDFKEILQQLNQRNSTLFLKIVKEKESTLYLKSLKDILKRYNGSTNVILHYENTHRTIQLPEKDWVEPSEQCIDELKDLLGNNNVILRS